MAAPTIPEKLVALEEKYAHELMGEEEKLELYALILALKKKLAATPAGK